MLSRRCMPRHVFDVRRPRRVFDVVTPTDSERRRAEQQQRERRYKQIMSVCLGCVAVGFFVPLPVPARGVLLLVSAVLLPVAAVIANSSRRR